MKSFFIKWYMGRVQRRIDKMASDPIAHQAKLFQRLVNQGRLTKFGRDHNFNSIKNHADFVKNVPPQTYDHLAPYVEKIRQGEKDMLWPGRPQYLATTSGTTSGEKFIPVTKESLKKGMASTLFCTSSYLQERKNTTPLFKKMVILSANPHLIKEKHLSYGKITGIFNRHIPSFMKKQRIPSVETNSLFDWDEKMKRTVQESIGQDVGMVGGFPAWIIRYFERLLEATGKKTISEVFPNLQVITHGGVAYPPYQKRMETLIGKPFDRLEVFSATEGFMAYQDQQDKDDMLLVPGGEIFYEFVPLSQWGDPEAPRLTLENVEVGVPYAMLITTLAGLWAYDIGDAVTFTSINPYRLKVSGRTKHFISNSGEHLISEQVEKALTETAAHFGVEVHDFSVAPHITNEVQGNRHEWLIEFKTPPEELEPFRDHLCETLRDLSDNYKLLIEGSVLYKPLISPVKAGGFVEYMKSINKMTHQNKVPRLMNNRSLADAMAPWKMESANNPTLKREQTHELRH